MFCEFFLLRAFSAPEISPSGIENFQASRLPRPWASEGQDQKFQARLKFSRGIEIFKRKAVWAQDLAGVALHTTSLEVAQTLSFTESHSNVV